MPQSGNSEKGVLNALKNFYETGKDIFFPVHCIGCGKHGAWICDRCLPKIIFLQKFLCPRCGNFSFLGELCVSCAKKSALKGVWAVASYQNEILREAIWLMKYKGIQELARPLGMLAAKFLSVHHITREFDGIIAVPLHRRKLYFRGYNQSELLAQELSLYFHCEVFCDVLVRTKFTRSQSRLNSEKREKNVQNAFRANEKFSLQDKKLLLIDDVMTSASTLSECARVLKQSGASEVWGLVLARG